MNFEKLPLAEQVEWLKAENANLKAEMAMIRAEIFEPRCIKSEWKMPHRERQIFKALLAARHDDFVTRGMLFNLLFDEAERELYSDNTVESHVSKLKARLVPFGIRLESARFLGYRVAPECKATILSRRKMAA